MRQWLLVSLIIILTSCDPDVVKPKIAFADEWEIAEVQYDAVEQRLWRGLSFTFEQTSDSAGVYYLPLTPYDTIWKASGTWRINSRKTQITFDDHIDAEFEVSNNQFVFVTYLPWTQQSTCTGDICLPVVTGNWVFRLHRKDS